MPRAPNFAYRDPTAEIGNALVRAIFGDPAMAAQQQQHRSELELRAAQAEMARAHGGLYTSQTEGVDQQNTAARGMPAFFQAMYAAPPPMPSLDDPNFVTDAGPSAPIPTRDDIFRAGLPAFLGNAAIMQGDKIDPRALIGTAAAFGGDDEMARRGLVAQGQTPGEKFALTPIRADAISARDAGESQTQAFGVAERNHASDVPVAKIRAGATVQAAQVGADGRTRVAEMKATGPAPGFDAIQRSFPGAKMSSGWRSVEHNREVGGVDNSSHLGKTPGVQGYDIPVQPSMTIDQAARKIEKDNGGAVQVVEALAHRAKKPDGTLGGMHWHFALKSVGGPANGAATSSGKPATVKPPRLLSKSAVGMIDTELTDHFKIYGITLAPAVKSQLKDRAIEIYQQTGNPVLAVRQAAQERADRRRAKDRPAPRTSAIPAGARTATGPGGKKMYFDGKAWVPAH